MGKVVITKDGAPFKELPLEAHMGIGRGASQQIQLEDNRLSRSHAEIYREGDSFFVKDRRSTNGTYLNGQKIDPDKGIKLGDSDFVTLGAFELRFVLDGAKAGAPAAAAARSAPAVYDGPPPTSPIMEHLISGRERIPVWSSGEIEVKVADLIDETHDVKTYRFVGQTPLMFSYKPGQFVTLNLNINGKDVKRSYSISSSPSRPHTLEVTIKRVPGGLVSNWMADNIKLGDLVKLKGPAGKFTCFEYPCQKMLFFGGGSGITPVMSMTRWIVDTTADIDVKFLACCRTPVDNIFGRELEYLSARHSGFQCAVTVSSGWGKGIQPWVGFTGRVTRQMIEMLAPDVHERHVFMCGPEPFMDSVKTILKDMGFPLANLHSESFGGARVAKGSDVAPRDVAKKPATVIFAPPPAAAAAVAAAPAARAAAAAAPPVAAVAAAAPAGKYEISFAKSGKKIRTDGEGCLLDLAEANGIEINYACRTGSCGECKVLCKGGNVEMESEEGLGAGEKEGGYVLTCVGHPKSSCTLEA
ncbi:MAG: FAD-binding oxidoreductase [Planctomycetes bacterium]|nr:FAD-binding oxidoreductase [Planctomycetota bacterium]